MLLLYKGVPIQGIIFKIESKDYYLFNEKGEDVRCSLRGKFQKEFNLKRDKLYSVDIATVGDNVRFEMNQDGTGVIEEILPRNNHISRKAPRIKGAGTRGERLEQKIAANIDSLVVVSSCISPKFNNRAIDRFLVAGESSHIKCYIIINKIDLDEEGTYKEYSALYRSIGYEVVESSVKENIGAEQLHKILDGKVNLVWGHSGVGKSSLLNWIYPHLKLKTGIVSDFSSKGKHTTVTSVMMNIDEKTKVIDTPGIREIDPYGIREEDLGHFFKDFEEYINECKFNTCTHQHEPGCAVIKAVEEELINTERYVSYLNILETIEEDMNF
ncbi:MAG: ribosome small subunit-dependent GTPase A [Melioribacteraceae bacterium]